MTSVLNYMHKITYNGDAGEARIAVIMLNNYLVQIPREYCRGRSRQEEEETALTQIIVPSGKTQHTKTNSKSKW